MKLSEFRELCQREWTREPHGDVTALDLTAASMDEFCADVISSGSPATTWLPVSPDEPGGACGAALSQVLNPVTMSVVRVRGGARADAAEVLDLDPHAPVPARTVLLGDAAARRGGQAVALAALADLAARQRETAASLRGAVGEALEAGVPWREIGDALGVPYGTVFRQYKAGSPVVVLRAYHGSRRAAS